MTAANGRENGFASGYFRRGAVAPTQAGEDGSVVERRRQHSNSNYLKDRLRTQCLI
jgi:hypothetical protein